MLNVVTIRSIVTGLLIICSLVCGPVSSSWAAFTLVAEANPNPVNPGQMLDVQVSISSTSQTGTLSLQMLWPAELGISPFVTGEGTCPGSCGAGEYLTWELGALEPSGSVSVGFNENVLAGVVNGVQIPLAFELLEGLAVVATNTLSVEVQSDSPLELAVDPLTDPVVPGGTLVYEIVYGNTGASNAENAELVLPLPAGTQFISATGNGVFSDGSVSWDLGSLRASSGSREHVSVQVDALAEGSLLLIDAATLSGDVALQPRQAHAMAVSRVATELLQLELETNPDPLGSLQMTDNQITVSNPGGSATGTLTLRVLWPEELSSSPIVTNEGGCFGSCSDGEFLTWDLGILGPTSSVSVSFNENVLNAVVDGTLIPLEVELLEGGLPARNRSHTLIKLDDSPLELAVDPLTDPIVPGGTLVYEIVYANAGISNAENAELVLPLPAGTLFTSATGNGVFADGGVSWDLGSLRANSGGRERVSVQVDTLAEGSLLLIDAATLTGDVALQPRQARAMAVSRVATELLQLELETNPDPLGSLQMTDNQITVSNPGGSATGTLTLRVLWPEELSSSPVVTNEGGCFGSCSDGEFLTWDLGILGPTSSVSVSFNENVLSGVDNGTLIPLEIELLEGDSPARNRSHTLIKLDDSPLELAVDPLTDPVVPGGTLVYEIVYGNTGSSTAENAELVLPLPVGTQFISATGGGVLSNDSVSWNLGSLAANSGGRERVSVQVDTLAEGSLLFIDAATLMGDVALQPRHARAMAVSRVATELLQLELEANPGPLGTGQMTDNQITVSNPGGSATGTLSLRMLWPEELNSSPFISNSGSCGGSCSEGEYLTWDLGELGANGSITVGFNENIFSNVVDGSLIPLEIELLEGGLPARSRSHTLIELDDSPLELTVDPLTDPVVPGSTLVYEIVYGNAGSSTAENAELVFPLPAGTQFISATGGGVFSNGSVSWNLGSFAANSGRRERVSVQVAALAEGSLLLVDAARISGDVAFQLKYASAMAVSRVATELLQLELEVNPNPLGTLQMIDNQITVSNPGSSATGTLSLRMLWPEELNSSPFISNGGGCAGSCSEGEYLIWDLGELGANGSITVGFNENIISSVVNGTLIPLEIELLEGGLPARNRSHTLIKLDDSPLELTVDPLTDPVVSGGTLVYELVYGNTGDSSAEGAELVFPLPAGTQFISATGGGVLSNGDVSWNLGSLVANSGGRVRVSVQVGALTGGNLLLVDAAGISGDVAFQSRYASAMAVSRVATELLQLELKVDPNPVAIAGFVNAEFTVTNPAGNGTGALILRVLWPEELNSSPDVSNAGGCAGSCSEGEYLIWDLGVLGPTGSVVVSFSENLKSNMVNGTIIPLEAELIEGSLPARNISKSILVHPFTDLDLDGEADIYDDDDDDDGMPDWWETLHGLDPRDKEDAMDDPDKDGTTNLEEFQNGTDPGVDDNLIFKDGFEDRLVSS